ncbi:MAG: SDR family oxidoreductase [Bacteroidota bacterium]
MNRKYIFITGGAQGIGAATARLFAQKGWFIGLFDLNQTGMVALQKEIGEEQCQYYMGNVVEPETILSALEAFSEWSGGQLHLLFNNAGILKAGGFEGVALESHKAVVDVNFTGLINVTHLALPLLKATPQSCIINMASASALYGNPEIVAYAATKSAVKSLTESWRMLFRKHDIKVCDLLPIYVDTPMVQRNYEALDLQPKNVHLTAEGIARKAWKAYHSRALHHFVGRDTQLLRFLKNILPGSWIRWILMKSFFKEALKHT